VIIGIAPMAYDPADPPTGMPRVVRGLPTRTLASEAAFARARGAQVLLIRPTSSQLAIHGLNSMRPDGAERIAQAARDATAEVLRTDRFQEVLAGVG